LNILSVNKFYWRKGGSEAVFFGEKDLLESHGHTVWPFSMHSPDNIESEFSRYFVDEVDYTSPSKVDKLKNASKIIYSFDARNKMGEFLNDYSPDIAQFHIFQHQISVSAFGPLRKRGIPIILTVHDLKPMCANYRMYVDGHVCEACKGGKYYNCFKNRCNEGSLGKSLINTVEMYFHHARGYYDWVDRYIVLSKFFRDKMLEWGFPEEKISYLPNYIDSQEISPSSSQGDHVLYFGRLSHEKGVEQILAEAKENADIPHILAGTGPTEDKLKEQARAMNLDNVKFVGFQSGQALKDLIANSRMTVISSVVYENCPMSVLESFAHARPVVGARIGGIPELIEEGVDGATFEGGNTAEFARAVRHYWDNPDAALQAGLAGREKVARRFSKDAHYQGLMDIYDSVLQNKRNAGR
jgi:glycosyltransferase involved in cell wall biosynthesis